MNQNAYGNAFMSKRHRWAQTLLYMKLTALFLLIACLHVSAETYSQKVSISGKNISLKQVFEMVKSQTGYDAIYNPELLKKTKKISVNIQNTTLQEALELCFLNQPIGFLIKYNTIVLTPKVAEKQAAIASDHATATVEMVQVTGKVLSEAGEPVNGASVVVKGTSKGTTTDEGGNFTIDADPGDILEITLVGHISQEVKVTSATDITIILKQSESELAQVVVIGYGTQKKASVTGAVSTVGPSDLTAVTTSDFSNTLTGKLPGLRVMQIGGEPGTYNNSIDIRGWGAMLVVVDGVPRDDFQRIDPAAIASVTILKDASAAVYGLKAANGVMLITTKKGQAGKPKISFNSSYGWQKLTEFPKPIRNAMDNLILKNEAALVAGNPLPYPDWEKYTGEDPDYPNVDWWGLTVRNAMPINKNSVTVSGGSEKVTYFFTVGNLYQSGLYNTKSMDYNRYNFRSNVTAKITNNLTANIILAGMIDEKNSPYGSSSYDFFKQVWMQPGYEPIYANNTAPYYYDGQADRNPLAIINSDLTGYRINQLKNYQTTATLTYDMPFVKGLQLQGLFAYDMNYGHNKIWRKAYNEYKYDEANDKYLPTVLTSPTNLQHTFNERIYTQTQLSVRYKNSFGAHGVEALVLGEARNGSGTGFLAQRNFALSALDQLNAGLNDNQVASGTDNVVASNQALVGRVNYDFMSKYLAEFSFRYDGSSLFPKDSRWGFFPGFSLGWRISEEAFLRNKISFLDNLKLRFSHGKLGDNSDALAFADLQGYLYPSGSYIFDGKNLVAGSSIKGLPNPSLTWYTATTTNLGVDAGLWNGLLDVTVELFQRKRNGLLAQRAIAVPPIFGAILPQENLNSDLSRGFEVVLSHTNRINDFTYNISTNLTYARARWKHYEAALPGNSYLNWRNSNDNRWKGIQWGYGIVGQFQNQRDIDLAPVQNANGHSELFPGDIWYEDWNQDGMIDDLDRHPIARSVEPEMFYGLNLSGSWKGISLNVFFQGASNYSMMPTEQLQGPLPWGRNSSQMFLDRWHHEDPMDFNSPWVPGKYPISRDGFGYGPNKEASTYWFQDVTYLRLKSVELAYSLPQRWISRISSQQARIFVNAFNLYTWKGKDITFDPEHRLNGDGADGGYKYPLTANYNIGIDITF